MNDLAQHISEVTAAHGERVRLLDFIGLSPDWTVTSNVPEGFWKKCRTQAYPLQPKLRCNGALPSKSSVDWYGWLTKYGPDILVVAIPDDEAMNKASYSAGPILISDLDRKPKDVLNDMLEYLSKGDEFVAKMKRRAVMMMLGWKDLK